MKHVFIDHGNDCDEPGNCLYCDGGIAECTVCGLAEGSLTTDCPGVHIDYETGQQVYDDQIDFVDGKWIKEINHAHQ